MLAGQKSGRRQTLGAQPLFNAQNEHFLPFWPKGIFLRFERLTKTKKAPNIELVPIRKGRRRRHGKVVIISL